MTTDSTVASSPTTAWRRDSSAAWSVPGRVRTSTSASPAPGMTLTFFPARRTVGVTVSRSIASIERRRTGSGTPSSRAARAPAGSDSARSATGAEAERAQEVADHPITRAGRSAWSAAMAAAARASRIAALASCGIEPWPGVPVVRSRVHAMPFSATWIV